MSRRTAREVAMKMTYEKLFGCDDTYRDVLEKSGIAEEPTRAEIEFAERIVNGVQEHLSEIDGLIASVARGWTLERMPRVDISILRNSVCEMSILCETPVAVVINEAVEMAKIYCDDKSPKFINGMLGALGRQQQE